MAEGGEPAPQEETHAEESFEYGTWNWDVRSLEYVFASDFIHLIMDTEDIGWRSHRLIEHCVPLTPFNTTIQKVVEEILRQDSTYLKFVFQRMTERCGKLNKVRFNVFAMFLKINYIGEIGSSFGHLLKYFCVLGLFSAWAHKQGLYAAPFFCVDIIIGYIREFLIENGFTFMDAFWFAFEEYSTDALRLPRIHMLPEENFRRLPGMLMRVEQQFAESDVAGSAENLEPEREIIPECTESESRGEKTSSEKENFKEVKVEIPSKAADSNVQISVQSEEQLPADEDAGCDTKTPEAQPPADEGAGFDTKTPEAQPPADEGAGSNTKIPEMQPPAEEGSDTKTQSAEPAKEDSDTKPQSAEPAKEDSDTKPQSAEPAKEDSDTQPQSAEPAKEESDTKPQSAAPTKKGSEVQKPSDEEDTESISPTKGATSVQSKSQGASSGSSKSGGKKKLGKSSSKSPGASKPQGKKTPIWK